MKGITVTLYDIQQTDIDPFNNPIFEEIPIEVENVLVAPTSSTEQTEITDLYGKRADYILAIPKGDMHTWTDRKVCFFNEKWQVFGFPTEGIEENIPLSWNKKVMVARYE